MIDGAPDFEGKAPRLALEGELSAKLAHDEKVYAKALAAYTKSQQELTETQEAIRAAALRLRQSHQPAKKEVVPAEKPAMRGAAGKMGDACGWGRQRRWIEGGSSLSGCGSTRMTRRTARALASFRFHHGSDPAPLTCRSQAAALPSWPNSVEGRGNVVLPLPSTEFGLGTHVQLNGEGVRPRGAGRMSGVPLEATLVGGPRTVGGQGQGLASADLPKQSMARRDSTLVGPRRAPVAHAAVAIHATLGQFLTARVPGLPRMRQTDREMDMGAL